MVDELARLSAFSLLALSLVGPSQAAIHALVIGVNEYPARMDGKSLTPLRGAVNDAQDVAAALRVAGVTDLRLLLNQRANKPAILQNWRELAEAAQPGDTLIFSFAGHGSQLPERIAGSEADGMDEVLLLGGLNEEDGRGNVLIDNEWRSLLQQVPENITVISLLDACHAGTAYRSGSGVRQVPPLSADAFVIGEIPPREPETQANEIVASATTDDGVVYEDFLVDGRPRGVASAVFARALRGDADADRNGSVSVDELRVFFNQQVLNLSAGKQVGTVAASGDRQRALFDALPRSFNLPAPTELPVSISGPGVDLRSNLNGITEANAAQALLRWESGLGLVFDHGGEVVATQIRDAERFQGVVDKYRLLASLDDVAQLPRLPVTSELPDSLLRAGAVTRLHVGRGQLPHLTVINLANDGTIGLLYPLPQEPSAPVGSEFVLSGISSAAPYGREHILALATASAPKDLRQLLGQLNDRRKALLLWPALAALLTGSTGSVEMGQGVLQTVADAP